MKNVLIANDMNGELTEYLDTGFLKRECNFKFCGEYARPVKRLSNYYVKGLPVDIAKKYKWDYLFYMPYTQYLAGADRDGYRPGEMATFEMNRIMGILQSGIPHIMVIVPSQTAFLFTVLAENIEQRIIRTRRGAALVMQSGFRRDDMYPFVHTLTVPELVRHYLYQSVRYSRDENIAVYSIDAKKAV